MILSDFHGPLLVMRELAPVKGGMCWIWGAEKDTLRRSGGDRQAPSRRIRHRYAPAKWSGGRTGCRERCTVPDDSSNAAMPRIFKIIRGAQLTA